MAVPLCASARTHLAALERRWAGSLHLAMLATPLRKCIVTTKVLPTALMVQLKPLRLPPAPGSAKSNSTEIMMPDHILHPKFKQPRKGKGCWISIHAGILEHARKRGVYKMVSNAALMLPSTRELVGKQLEERVVQELQLLESHFAHGRNGPFTTKEAHQTAFEISHHASHATHPVFHPDFTHESHKAEFKHLLAKIAHTSDTNTLAVRRSPVTIPLGVALYRLQLWTSSLHAPA